MPDPNEPPHVTEFLLAFTIDDDDAPELESVVQLDPDEDE